MKSNKGFTVVELIVTFVFVMVIAIGLFSIINSYKEKTYLQSVDKEMSSYRNEILKAIYDDINLFGIKRIETIFDSEELNKYDNGIKITFFNYSDDESEEKSKKLLLRNAIDDDTAIIKYGSIEYKAPNSFIDLPNDFLFSALEGNFDTQEDSLTKVTYKINKSAVNIKIPILNKENNKNYDINIITSVYSGSGGDINKIGLDKGKEKIDYYKPVVCYAMDGTTAVGYKYNEPGCNRENITIPAMVSDIELKRIGSYAFSTNSDSKSEYINKIKTIDFSNAKNLIEIENGAFENNGTVFGSYYYSVINDTKNILKLENFTGAIKLKIIGKDAFSKQKVGDSITIPKSVTSIGEFAFAGSNLTSLVFESDSGETIQIGKNAFYANKGKIGSLDLTDRSFSSIGDYAFSGTGINATLSLPSNQEYTAIYGDSVFSNNSITNIVIPANIMRIGTSAFENAINLKELIIPKNVAYIGISAFKNNTFLEKLSFEDNSILNEIDSYAFSGSSYKIGYLNSVSLPNSLVSIKNNAFAYNSISSITIPSNLINIEKYAFYNNRLATINMQGNNKIIGTAAFNKNVNADDVTIYYDNGSSSKNFIYSYNDDGTVNMTSIIGYANSSKSVLVIPDDVTTIGESAFEGTSISELVIPPTVKYIGNYAFANTNLQKITFQDRYSPKLDVGFGVFNNNSIPNCVEDLIYNKKTCPVKYIVNGYEKIGDGFIYKITDTGVDTSTIVSYGGKTKSNITIPYTVKTIEKMSFYKTFITGKLTIPNSVITINGSAFQNNNYLSEIILKGRTTIPNTFDSGWNLKYDVGTPTYKTTFSN